MCIDDGLPSMEIVDMTAKTHRHHLIGGLGRYFQREIAINKVLRRQNGMVTK